MPICVSHTAEDLWLEHSCSFNSHGQAYYPTAVDKWTAAIILRALRTQEYRLITFKSQTRPHPEHFPINPTHLYKVDWIAMENVRWTFIRNLLGPSPSITYRTRCELLGREILWLRRVELKFAFLFNLYHNNFHSAKNTIHDADSPLIPLRSRYCLLKIARCV